MTHPGDRLRAMSARLCSDRTMEQLIDPVLADLQTEYSQAHRRGQTWRKRWILAVGYVAFLKVIIACGCERPIRTLLDCSADDRQALRRTIALGVAAMLAVTVLLSFPPMLQFFSRFHANQTGLLVNLVYLIPEALPIAVPVGFTLGIFVGLGGRAVSPRLKRLVLATGLLCSVASFATMAWIRPAAHHAFLQSVQSVAPNARLTPGPSGRTLTELRQQVDSYTTAGRASDARNLRFAYHMRWAFPCATFALAWFALSVAPGRPVSRWLLGVGACAACLCYYFLLLTGEIAGRQGTLPAVAGAWLPNVVFAVASATLLVAGSHRSTAIPSK